MSEPAAAEGRPLVGDVIAGKYRIESIAGEGGMGIVYEAEHVILRQRVAVKALPPGASMSVDAIERFSVEASAIARITSEHVVRVMDAGTLPDGTPYLVMEYLDGSDLERLLEVRGPLQPRQVVDFTLQALDGLAHAHAAHVIHRDLKPANLFLARGTGGRMIIKLVDFGISMSFGLTLDEDHVAGSPMYMSPEQLRGAQLDVRTDLWSLGVVIYELLAGAPPFVGTFSQIVTAILEHDVLPLHEKDPSIDRDLSNIVGKCLRRDPKARWATTAELARALAPFGTGAWAGALERINRALLNSAPIQTTRRFESFDNALQALETDEGDGQSSVETLAPPDANPRNERSSSPDDTPFRETMLAPPSEVQGYAGAWPKEPALPSSTLRSAQHGAYGPISGAHEPAPASRAAAASPPSSAYVPPSRAYASAPAPNADTAPPSSAYAPSSAATAAPPSSAYAQVFGADESVFTSAAAYMPSQHGQAPPASSAYRAPVSVRSSSLHKPFSPTTPEALPPSSRAASGLSALPASMRKPPLRILLIDDSEIVLGLHGDALSWAGFDVRTTMSVGEFDVLLESWRPHLVVMDVEMPGVSGDVLCSRVKAKFRATVPVVFVSGLARDELAERASTGGADAFLTKTSDVSIFVSFVRNICAITYSPDDLP